MNFDHDLGLISNGIISIDTTVTPPAGGTAGVFQFVGTGALQVQVGTTLERPTGVVGMVRYNTTIGALESFDGITWALSSLNDELTGLSGLSANGIVTRTGDGTYASRTITGTPGNIDVTNGSGVSGNPTINLPSVGTPVGTGSPAGALVKITTDAQGRVSYTTPVITSDITPLVDSVYVNVSGDTMTSGANLTFAGGGEVLGLPATPSNGTAATSRAYVDGLVQGLTPKQSVRVSTTTAGTLASSFEAGDVIDTDVTLVIGDRILIKNQADPIENGIYVVQSSGAPTRALDMNVWTEVPSAYVFVEEGATLKDTGWVCTSNAGGSIGADPINWVQFSGAGSYTAGAGITITGTVVSLVDPVTLTLGGTNNTNLTASNGGIVYTDASMMQVLAGTTTARQMLQSGASAAPAWSTATYPATTTLGGIFYSSANNVVSELALGASNLSIVGVNHAGTNVTNRTLVAGTGISITSAAETITIANTIAALQLYKENPSTPTSPSATGTNAVAIGNGSTASAINSTAIGNGTDSKVWGGTVTGNGKFATAGDAQSGLYVLRGNTDDATAGVELFLDGTTLGGGGSSRRLTLSANSLMTFTVLVAGRRTSSTGGGAGYRFDGVIKKDATNGTTTFVGTPSKQVLGETNILLNANVVADTTNGALRVTVTGAAGNDFRWVATVTTSEVMN